MRFKNISKNEVKSGNVKLIFCLFILISGFTLKVYPSNYNDTIPTPSILSKFKGVLKNAPKIFSKKKKYAQKVATKKIDTLERLKKNAKVNHWSIKHNPGIILTQTSFVNWTKGGSNTIAGIATFKSSYNYKKGFLYWKNNITLRYGLSKEDGIKLTQKTDDLIDLKSSYGYKTGKNSKWYYAGEFNLTTQFSEGYKGAERTNIISDFFSPARIRLGAGANYTLDNFKLHLSPLTNQTTLVLDRDLADIGAFGVQPAIKDSDGNIIKSGETSNIEFGILIRVDWHAKVMKNVEMNLRSSFYSDYLNNFGNVDTDIDLSFDLRVNKFLNANIGSHLIYDDDAKIIDDDGTELGPKVQLKQILGVGISYIF